jgi:predicted AAA+ superfamily ATPase
MEAAIVGRTQEKEVLRRLLGSNSPELLAIYGRRRVGKTFLIDEFFEDKAKVFEVTGAKDAPKELQLARFSVEMQNAFEGIGSEVLYHTWDEGLQALVKAVEGYQAGGSEERVVLFFDEIPWLDGGNSGFLSALDYAWNRHFSKSKFNRLLIVICGSAASWMIKKVINSRGGLHNRVTEVLRLMPFTLGETRCYLESLGVQLDNRQMIELYMALGGIPAYLRHARPGLSSTQIINELCFTSGKFLSEEFDRLFASLFAKYHNHVRIVRALASAPKGLTRSDILLKTGLPDGGNSTLYLNELEQSGFIMSVPSYGRKKRGRFYRLSDEYSLFYLKWIDPLSQAISAGIESDYWMRQSQRPTWPAWAGYAFEGLCIKHIGEIKRALGIAGVVTREFAWECPPDRATDRRGAQVDLVIERADHTINLCELKFVRHVFEITPEYRLQLEYKAERFRSATGTHALLLTTLLTPYGARENKNYFGAVHSQLTIDALFGS